MVQNNKTTRRRPGLMCKEYIKRPSQDMKNTCLQEICWIENEKKEPFWEYYKKYSPERLLLQFKESKTDRKEWEVIPFEQYYNLLKRYIDDPISARIPDNIVTNWITIICKNLAQVISIEKLFGRCAEFPFDAVEKFCDISIQDREKHHIIPYMNALSDIGFYEWATSPEGNPAWNDWGFKKVYDILTKYREDMEPGDKLILIDRCLNVVHGRGPMAEYFIEGGRKALDIIANKSS